MLNIIVKVPTKRLKIRRSLAKLFQSYVYHQLDSREHKGYKHPNGKVFKSMNFKIFYSGNTIVIKYSALDKENEKKVAMAVLNKGLKLGEIHIAQTEVSLDDHQKSVDDKIRVKGFVVAAIKDGKSNKKIYLEPKTHKFQEIVHTHTIQKYEVLFGEPYKGELKIVLLSQQPKPQNFFYHRAPIKAWHGVYEIEADKKMTEMILDTGLGSQAMQGLGFVELVKPREKPKKQKQKELDEIMQFSGIASGDSKGMTSKEIKALKEE